jgi:superfamily II DNA/RNA helicase
MFTILHSLPSSAFHGMVRPLLHVRHRIEVPVLRNIRFPSHHLSLGSRCYLPTADATSYDGDLHDDSSLTNETFVDRYGEALPLWLLDKCVEMGWIYPTQIQQYALDTILRAQPSPNDIILQAQTGSGKTLCYLLPLLASIDPSRRTIQALVIVPTRELGLQIARLARRLAASATTTTEMTRRNTSSVQSPHRIIIMNVLQGSMNRRQRAWAWADPPHVIIGTPQEVCNMVQYGGIKRYNSVKFVVVDEVDACLLNNAGTHTSNLDSSPLHELLSQYLSPTYDDGTMVNDPEDPIASLTSTSSAVGSGMRPFSNERRTILCSATIPQPRHFVKQCASNQWTIKEPIHLSLQTGEQQIPSTLTHAYFVCNSAGDKLPTLRRVLQKILHRSKQKSHNEIHNVSERKVLVFAEDRRSLEEFALDISRTLRGLYIHDARQLQQLVQSEAVVSVLRFENSISERAVALDVFRGESSYWTTENDGGVLKTQSVTDETPTVSKSTTQQSHSCLRVLLTTDLAARGLDITDITHVVQFDLPPDADTYAHRAGRTGRFGRVGHVLSIVTADQEFALKRLANKLNVFDINCLARKQIPSGQMKKIEYEFTSGSHHQEESIASAS